MSEPRTKTFSQYFWRLLIGLDQFANCILAGKPDETISSRAGKALTKGKAWAVGLCAGLNVVDRNHCEKSVEADE